MLGLGAKLSFIGILFVVGCMSVYTDSTRAGLQSVDTNTITFYWNYYYPTGYVDSFTIWCYKSNDHQYRPIVNFKAQKYGTNIMQATLSGSIFTPGTNLVYITAMKGTNNSVPSNIINITK